MEYASRLQRFLAFVIDTLALIVIEGVLTVIGVIDLGDGSGAGIGVVIVTFGYYILLTAVFGATLGKMALDIRVVDESGRKAGFLKVLIRETIGKFVSAFVFFLGFIWILFDGKHQGWHDKIGGTFVVRAR